jgi:hypothetical protein
MRLVKPILLYVVSAVGLAAVMGLLPGLSFIQALAGIAAVTAGCACFIGMVTALAMLWDRMF